MEKLTWMKAPNGEVFETSNPAGHPDCLALTKAAGKAARAEYCRAELKKILKPKDTVYCVLRSCNRNGDRRVIALRIVQGATKTRPAILRSIDVLVSDMMGHPLARDGVVFNGGGMDMGFEAVYRIGKYMWPNGTPRPHGFKNGEPSNDGGYALQSEWV